MSVWTEALGSAVAWGLPLLLAGLGGACWERAGYSGIALEGAMIAGAAAGCFALNALPQGAVWALPCMALAGVAGALWGLPTRRGKAGRGVGMGLNLLAPALTVALLWLIKGKENPALTVTDSLRLAVTGEGLFAKLAAAFPDLAVPAALVTMVLLALILSRTRFGLQLKIYRESPEALAAAGASPTLTARTAALLGGAAAGMAGFCLVVTAGTQGPNAVGGWGLAAAAVAWAGRRKPLTGLLAGGFVILAGAVALRFIPDRLAGAEYLVKAAPFLAALLLAALLGDPRKKEGD